MEMPSQTSGNISESFVTIMEWYLTMTVNIVHCALMQSKNLGLVFCTGTYEKIRLSRKISRKYVSRKNYG
jgi:hypothetical protein